MAGSKMAWSKSTRIKVMIFIDTVFFLLELIAGVVSSSLALQADAFHMLNDIISLAIGLWAVVAAQKATTDEFTFGWVRAEILGAFFNAVFLIALCVSIILEAFTRFLDPPDISNPKLMFIIGSAGLFSNFVGFFVLGGHGHSHGHGGDDHEHDHDHDHDHNHEHGFGHGLARGDGYQRDIEAEAADESGSVNEVLPEVIVRRATRAGGRSSTDLSDINRSNASSEIPSRAASHSKDWRRTSKTGHSRFASIEDMSIHPASFRQEIISASMHPGTETTETSESEVDDENTRYDEQDANEESPLLRDTKGGHGTLATPPHNGHNHAKRPRRDSSVHIGHNHNRPGKPSKSSHGHSHDDMGMNAMILHVIGDMLGNIGVMATALVIWLTDWPGKNYADPVVSLFITAIILKTSIPLTRATSKVLLQATPEHICIQDIRQDIEALPGVVSCHHIHVWQLSDTKVVASMHVQVSFPIDSHCGEKYMQLAKRARKCLHSFGIHSATIQPEFCLDQQHQHAADEAGLALDGTLDAANPDVCLLECIDECNAPGCCTSQENGSKASSTRRASDSSHSHGSHGHEPHRHS